MTPRFVKPQVVTNKNDAADADADAEAIRETVARPNMRFVPIKNIEQQPVLALHRARQGFVKARTAQANQIRGLPGEFGLIIPQGIVNIAKRVVWLAAKLRGGHQTRSSGLSPQGPGPPQCEMKQVGRVRVVMPGSPCRCIDCRPGSARVCVRQRTDMQLTATVC